MKLERKQDLNVLYQVCVFWADRKNKTAALASDWLRHFRLLLWNCWTEFNETWQEARSQRPLPSLCFWADPKNKMAALASDSLRHFRLLLWNQWTEFNETWQEARSQCPLPSLCFSGRSEKQDGRPGLWFVETFSTSPLKPMNGIQRNLTGSKILTSSTKFVFFRLIGKIRWLPWPLIHLDIFDFSSETAERNSWQNKTWQEARSQRPLPSFCFSGWLEKQDGRPGLWLAETFSTSPLKPLNGIWRNLTGSKISTSSKFVFFGLIGKTRWPPWPHIGWDILDFSSETTERPATKLDRKKDLNVLYQVCFLGADWKNRMAALANPSKRWHIVLRCTICGPLGLLFYTLANEVVGGGYTGFKMVVCLSVPLCICLWKGSFCTSILFPFDIRWWYFTHVLTMTRGRPLLILVWKGQGQIGTWNFVPFQQRYFYFFLTYNDYTSHMCLSWPEGDL